MSRLGRPPECTPEITDSICRAAAKGVALRNLHNHGPIGKRVLWNWIRRGEAGDEPYASFVQRLQTARAEFEGKALDVLAEAGAGNWVPLGWLLERSFGYTRDPGDQVEPEPAPETREDAIAALRRLPPDLLRAALDDEGEG